MSNKERIEQLEAWRISADRRIDNLIVRVKALESAVTLTDMGWATAEPEPSLPSPWQPMETCEDAHMDFRWFTDAEGEVWEASRTWRKFDADAGRIAWCSATDHPEAPPHPDVLGKVEPSVVRPTVVDWQPIETVPLGMVRVRRHGGDVIEMEITDIESFLRITAMTHWAPLPAPPTEPAPKPECDVLGKVEPSGDTEDDSLLMAAWGLLANVSGGEWGEQHSDWVAAVVRWREQFHAHLDAVFPAPLTEPAEPFTTCPRIARHSKHVCGTCGWMPEAPEPSPDKAERYTVTEWSERTSHLNDTEEGWSALLITERAERIAAALNTTPDPLLVGLVDAAVAWRTEWFGAPNPYPNGHQAIHSLAAAIDAYLAGEEGDQ